MILKQTRHRNIIRLFEYFETQKHILFVIELSSGGDLLSYVRKRRQLKEEVAKSVFKQIVEGIKYCHSKKILHRDIKLDNILLTVEGVVKICDFGVSKIVKPGEQMSEQCGTPAYIAPEILLDKGYEGFAVDIWSAGVVLYAMLYGTVPFKANNMSELQKMIIKAKFTLQDGISKEAKDLLRQLLEKDPTQRITIPNILAHPWIKEARDTVELFTNAEKNYMKYEFSCQEQGGLPELDLKNGDPFMDQMLDTL